MKNELRTQLTCFYKKCDYAQITSDLSPPASKYKYKESLYHKLQMDSKNKNVMINRPGHQTRRDPASHLHHPHLH